MWSSLTGLLLRFRTSLLFTPLLFAIGGLGLSFATVYVDQLGYGRQIAKWLPGTPRIDEIGARAMFSTVASGMFSATSIVISLTFVALTMMSSQMGPRLLAFFLRDRTTKISLGIFVATIIYSLVSMASVGAEGEATFAPHVSFITAIVLACVSLCTMVFFVDHIAKSIQTDAIVARLARECHTAIDAAIERTPRNERTASRAEIADFKACFHNPCEVWRAGQSGYLTSLNQTALLDLAETHNAIIDLRFRVNCFVFAGEAVALFRCRPEDRDPFRKGLAAAVAFGEHRTPAKQIDFEMSALSEVALRALSPGINDPHTAAACISYLGSALSRIAEEKPSDALLFDDKGIPRILRVPGDLPFYLDTCIAPVIEAGAGAPVALAALIRMTNWLAAICQDTANQEAVARQRAALEHLIAERITHPTERTRLLNLFIAQEQPV
jgi:uncharacterized membrane protein